MSVMGEKGRGLAVSECDGEGRGLTVSECDEEGRG